MRASSAGDYLRMRHNKNRSQKNNESRYSFAGFTTTASPSESPRIQIKQVDIDLDEPSPRVATPPRERGVSNLDTLIESDNSPGNSDLKGAIPLDSNKDFDNIEQSNVTNTDISIDDKTIEETENDNKLDALLQVDHVKLSESHSVPLPDKGNVPAEEVAPASTAENNLEDEKEPSVAPSLKVGDVVKISDTLEGQVRFYGRTQFADGVWVGVALSVPEGEFLFDEICYEFFTFVSYMEVNFMLK